MSRTSSLVLLLISVALAVGAALWWGSSGANSAGRAMNSVSAMQERMSAGFSTSSQRFGPLPAGRYQVVVEALDGRTASKPVRLAGQEERTIRVRLKD